MDTFIYTITGVRKEEDSECPFTRCFGFYLSLEDAIVEVKHNSCDMCEAGYYDLIVIEKYQPGIYVIAHQELWFEYVQETDSYVEIDKPEWSRGISCYGFC